MAAAGRWERASGPAGRPYAALDLDAFDDNAADLTRRAAGRPIRVASKSVRCRALLRRVLERPGFAGVMAYAADEAVWLVRHGFTDVFVAYPSVDTAALAEIAGDDGLRREVALAIDGTEHVDVIAGHVGRGSGIRVVLDVDASLRVGPVHLGVRRSPLRTPEQALALVRVAQRAGLEVVGVMFYDAQVAGLPDSGPPVRLVKARSVADLHARRAPLVAAVREHADLAFVNGGGTGSLHRFADSTSVTELAAGSGLYGPTLFDGYDDVSPRPAMAFAVPVVRRPGRGIVTAFSGGYAASGPAGTSRLPLPADPSLRLVGAEGAGEVQTPLRGPAADRLRLGDRVWMRGAKAGELLERFAEVHLVSGGEPAGSTPTYRGEGKCFG